MSRRYFRNPKASWREEAEPKAAAERALDGEGDEADADAGASVILWRGQLLALNLLGTEVWKRCDGRTLDELLSALHEQRLALTELDQPPAQRQQRFRIAALRVHAGGPEVVRDRKPGLDAREARVQLRAPLHRRALGIAVPPRAPALRVARAAAPAASTILRARCLVPP